MMISRIQDSNVQPTVSQLGGIEDWDLFKSGRLGMIPTGIWAFSEFTDECNFNWDIAVEPGEVQKATHFFSNAFVVNAESKNKEAASTWINWLASSEESAKIRIDAGWELPAIKDTSILNKYLEITPPENRQAVFDSVNYLVMPPVIEDYALMSDTITEKLSKAAAGEITAKEALDEAQKECEAKIKLK
jgi:multiple sugar transport system substrate-binding protein